MHSAADKRANLRVKVPLIESLQAARQRETWRLHIFQIMSSYDPPLSDRELARLMMRHGIVCRNRHEELLLEQRIKAVGYYRLEEYTWPFRKFAPGDKSKRSPYFKQPMPFDPIWSTYLFDRRMRILLLDAIERFEIAIRNAITQILVMQSGSNTPHSDLSLLPGFASVVGPSGTETKHQKWLGALDKAFLRSDDARILHCRMYHGTARAADLPLWILMELTSFGDVKTLYENMRYDLKEAIACSFGVSESFLTSSFKLLHQVRNRCAHHKRIWNYSWTKKRTPLFSHSPADGKWYASFDIRTKSWESPCGENRVPSFNKNSTAFVTILCRFWLDKISQTSQWKTRVEHTVYSRTVLLKSAKEAGFFTAWEKHPLWSAPS